MELDLTTIWDQLQTTLLSFLAQLPLLLLGLLVFVIFIWLSGRSAQTARTLVNRRSRSQNAATVVGLITRWGLLLLGLLVSLSIIVPSFEASDLIQVLGIGSVAVGFAFRDVFQNFLAGLIILLTDAFHIGDQIIVEGQDLEGTVTDIQTRATTIKTYDDRQIIIPNATLFTNPVTINTASKHLRSDQVVGISYDSDIDSACAVLLQAVKTVDGVLAMPAPDVLVHDLADSSINLRVRWWTDAHRSQVTQTKSAVVRAIKYALDENGIEIPFPVRTLYIRRSEDTDDG